MTLQSLNLLGVQLCGFGIPDDSSRGDRGLWQRGHQLVSICQDSHEGVAIQHFVGHNRSKVTPANPLIENWAGGEAALKT